MMFYQIPINEEILINNKLLKDAFQLLNHQKCSILGIQIYSSTISMFSTIFWIILLEQPLTFIVIGIRILTTCSLDFTHLVLTIIDQEGSILKVKPTEVMHMAPPMLIYRLLICIDVHIVRHNLQDHLRKMQVNQNDQQEWEYGLERKSLRKVKKKKSQK